VVILSAQSWRKSEKTEEGKLTNIIPSIGLFHFLWECMKIIFKHAYMLAGYMPVLVGNEKDPGTLSYLRVPLGKKSIENKGVTVVFVRNETKVEPKVKSNFFFF